jgi:hypothetical protein
VRARVRVRVRVYISHLDTPVVDVLDVCARVSVRGFVSVGVKEAGELQSGVGEGVLEGVQAPEGHALREKEKAWDIYTYIYIYISSLFSLPPPEHENPMLILFLVILSFVPFSLCLHPCLSVCLFLYYVWMDGWREREKERKRERVCVCV